ncbi:MAG: MFS transporter [Paracoccaceae bacterium]
MQDTGAGRWAVAAMFAVNGLIMGAWATQIPLLLPRHSITESTLGILIFVLGVGAVGSMLYSGRLITAYGSRRVTILFGVMTAPMLPLVVLAPNLWLLALSMALMGAVIGCMDVAMNANAVEVERRLSRAIMSSSHGFWSLGGFVGGILGGLILARWGAEVQALIAGAVALAGVLAAAPWLIAEAVAPKVKDAPVKRQTLFPRKPVLWLLGVMALFSMVPEGAVLDWAAIYLAKELGSDTARSGLAFGLFAGTMAVMRFAGDGVRNRFGAVLTIRVSGLIGAAGLMLAALAPTDLIAVAGFAVAGIGVANMVPILFSAGGNQPGISASAGIATVTMMGYCGILVAPSTIGFAGEAFGFRVTYAALSLLLVVVASLAGYVAAADGARHAQAASSPAT